jgi:hypothetical protein
MRYTYYAYLHTYEPHILVLSNDTQPMTRVPFSAHGTRLQQLYTALSSTWSTVQYTINC